MDSSEGITADKAMVPVAVVDGGSGRQILKELHKNTGNSNPSVKSSPVNRKFQSQLVEVIKCNDEKEQLIQSDSENLDEKPLKNDGKLDGNYQVEPLKTLYSTSILLPDIVNVTPNPAPEIISAQSNDDSLIARLTTSLSNLNIAHSSSAENLRALNHTPAKSNSDISCEDDETFADCESFYDATATVTLNDTVAISDRSWNNVVTSLTAENFEDLENLAEHPTDEKVELLLPEGVALDGTAVLDKSSSILIDNSKETVTVLDCNDIIKSSDQNFAVVFKEVEEIRPREASPAAQASAAEISYTKPLEEFCSLQLENQSQTEVVSDSKNKTSIDLNTAIDDLKIELSQEIISKMPEAITTGDGVCQFNSLTFEPNTEALNSTANLPLNGTLDAQSLNAINATFDSRTTPEKFTVNGNRMLDVPDITVQQATPEQKSIEIPEITVQQATPEPFIQQERADGDQNSNENIVQKTEFDKNQNFENGGGDSIRKSISLEKIDNVNSSVEAMDVDDQCEIVEQSSQQFIQQEHVINSSSSLNESEQPSVTKINATFAARRSLSREQDAPSTFVENFTNDPLDVLFKIPSVPAAQKRKSYEKQINQEIAEQEQFSSNGLILNESDFDFLLSQEGNTNCTVDLSRSSLLLKFDPLLGCAVPVNQTNQLSSGSVISTNQNSRLPITTEEEDSIGSVDGDILLNFNDNQNDKKCSNESGISNIVNEPTTSFVSDKPDFSTIEESVKEIIETSRDRDDNIKLTEKLIEQELHKSGENNNEKNINQVYATEEKKDAKMSVDVIHDIKSENDIKSFEDIKSKCDEKQNYKMAELEKKIKNEVLKTEDIEKKLKDAEQREEAHLKRITEKDKTIAKMNSVMAEYEKAIAEIITDKEQTVQNYEKKIAEIKSDRDLNFQHLNSLETTFSDLHAKYERSKQITATLKASEEALMAEKKQNLEHLRLQEQRYEKMKNHAMQQLEMANNRLESLTKNHASEMTKLKALLKKEEISRLSIAEQLQQKSRENEELMKICDELINGQGS